MNKTMRPADFIEWDVRNWSAALDFWSAYSQQDTSNCLALELGSRNGGLSLWLALQGARVLCSDIVMPTSYAIEQHHVRGVSPLIQYESIDASNIPYENKFDIIVFKSLLGAVGRRGGKESQDKAIAEMHKALKEGGELFFAENLIASPLHQSLRRRFVKWGTTWRYISVAEMNKFLSRFSRVRYRTLGCAGAFGRGERQRDLFGILDQTVLSHIVPENWRYIIVGVATK
jgi:SAM-dependent methyltransferase